MPVPVYYGHTTGITILHIMYLEFTGVLKYNHITGNIPVVYRYTTGRRRLQVIYL